MEDDGGLFNIEVSSADESAVEPKVPRDHQSESEFQKQKRQWRPKVEKGEVRAPLDIFERISFMIRASALAFLRPPHQQPDEAGIPGHHACSGRAILFQEVWRSGSTCVSVAGRGASG